MSGVSVSWASFNEKNPYGKDSVSVEGDNIPFSQQRWEAIKAVKQRRATPEQMALVTETDEYIRSALEER